MAKQAKFLFFVWTSFVFTLLAWPMPEYEGTIETSYDKVAHIFMFGIFSFLFLKWRRSASAKRSVYIYALALGIAYPFFGELVQSVVPGRDVSEKDLAAGIIGSLTGIIIFKLFNFPSDQATGKNGDGK